MPTTKIRGRTQIQDRSIDELQISSTAGITAGQLAEGADLIRRTGSVPFTADQSMGGNQLTNVGDPEADHHAVPRSWVTALVDTISAGLDPKGSVVAVATANVASLSGTQTVGGVALSIGDRVLLTAQTDPAENGIHVVAAGAWTRPSDYDSSPEISEGAFAFVTEGDGEGSGWVLRELAGSFPGYTTQTWTQFSDSTTLTAGAGLVQNGQAFDVNPGTGLEVVSDAVRLADNGTTGAKLNDDTAGAGLVRNGGTKALDINVGEGVEINADALRAKLDGTSLLRSGNGLKVNPALRVVRETPGGTINGSNAAFTLAQAPSAGTEEVFLNGILLEPGAGNDYTISGLDITMLQVPQTGDRLRVSYMK